MGPTVVLDVSEKRKASSAYRELKHDSLVIQAVAWSLYRPRYPGSEYLMFVLVNGKVSSSEVDNTINNVLHLRILSFRTLSFIQCFKNIRKHVPKA